METAELRVPMILFSSAKRYQFGGLDIFFTLLRRAHKYTLEYIATVIVLLAWKSLIS